MGRRRQALTVINGILWLVATIVLVQLWLVTAALEAFLAGHREATVPAAGISFALAGLNAALLLFVYRVDRRVRLEGTEEQNG